MFNIIKNDLCMNSIHSQKLTIKFRLANQSKLKNFKKKWEFCPPNISTLNINLELDCADRKHTLSTIKIKLHTLKALLNPDFGI